MASSWNTALVVALWAGAAVAQVSFPEPQYLPPDASSGAQTSQNPSVPNEQWGNLLGNALFFYDAQRSGHLPSSNRVSWRNDSGLDDGSDNGVDLSGGYFDAGNFLKVTFPLSFTLMSTCWGATEFGRGYDLANQTAYLDSMLRWGLDWLIKAHPSNDTLYVLVEDDSSDGAYWGSDRTIPTPRTSFQINSTHPGTDVAAQASAAFAACAALYSGVTLNPSSPSPASLTNETYASELMGHAQSLYSFATNAQGGQRLYQDSVTQAGDSYGSSGFFDELSIASIWLGLVTNSSDLLNNGAQIYTENNLASQSRVFNWDSKSPGIPVLLSQIGRSRPELGVNAQQWQSEAENYFDSLVQQSSSSQSSMTDGGLLWYEGDSDQASLNPALNSALLLSLYSPIASSGAKQSAYNAFADRQLNYALGDNPMQCPYVVGQNPNSPQNPHSSMASGGNDLSTIDTVPPQEAYVLYGAVIGGPDRKDRMYDIRSDWPQTEAALDYNAPLLSLAALHIMNDSADPFFTRLQSGAYASRKPSGTPCDEVFPCHSGLSTGAKIAIAVVITTVGLIIVGLLAYIFFGSGRKRIR